MSSDLHVHAFLRMYFVEEKVTDISLSMDQYIVNLLTVVTMDTDIVLFPINHPNTK